MEAESSDAQTVEHTLRSSPGMRCFSLSILFLTALSGCQKSPETNPEKLRIMTYNLEDVRTDDLLRADHPRLRAAARVIQKLKPDILLLNEIAYDQPGVPGYVSGETPGQNGQLFADTFLALSQGPDFEPLQYRAFMAPSNTGRASGFDLDHDGFAVTEYPEPPSASPDGTQAPQTADGRAFGNDNWGFGTFPGQYAMALLVREDLEIVNEDLRTFQHFLWSSIPKAGRPVNPETGENWYGDEVWNAFPLSSKSHWDVPVRLLNGTVLHVLASHPTPAAFDGPERRNKLRNRDEIGFWSAYVSAADYIVDDRGKRGGLEVGSSFVILGDLNADPDEGGSIGDPIGSLLLAHPLINGDFVPVADSSGILAFPNLDSDDTAQWGMRVDYVLPSIDLPVLGGRIVRGTGGSQERVSDHFPVLIDIQITKQ